MNKIISLLLIIFLVSCNNETDCTSCYTEEDGTNQIELFGSRISFKYWFDESKITDKYKTLINDDSDNIAYKIFKNTIGNKLKIEQNEIAEFILFSNRIVKNNEKLSLKDIVGFQVYYDVNNNLKTSVYKISPTQEILSIKELENNDVNYVSYNDIHNCSKIFKQNTISAMIIINNSYNFKIEKGVSNFKKNLKKYKRNIVYKNIAPIDDSFVEGGSGCYSPCNGVGDECLTLYDRGYNKSYKCFKGICSMANISNDSNEFSTAYEFRDNFLSRYTIGRKYIDYYYKLGLQKHLFKDTNWDELRDIKPLVLNKINELMHGNTSKILINDEEKISIMIVLSNLQSSVNNPEFDIIIDDVKHDIIVFSNKTIKDILDSI